MNLRNLSQEWNQMSKKKNSNFVGSDDSKILKRPVLLDDSFVPTIGGRRVTSQYSAPFVPQDCGWIPKSEYVSGFELFKVRCAGCAFDEASMDYLTQEIVYPLKEKLFAEMERLHDEDVKVQSKKYKCKGRKLTISYNRVAVEKTIS